MKSLVRLLAIVLLTGPAALPVEAAFTSIYVFGDGVSTTTNNPLAGPYYHGLRRSNGRVWVEVLAQRQALPNNTITNINWSYAGNNWSFFGHYSSLLVQNVNSFIAPADASTALFVVWLSNADFVYNMSNYALGNLGAWTNAVNQSLTNHWNALTNLYVAKGARTLILPNAVDITRIPAYVYLSAANKAFVRQRVIEFNTSFAALVNQARTLLPAAKLYVPDMFALLDDIVDHPANYGVTNALYEGQSVAALDDPSLTDVSLNGPGASYIFWDDMDPAAQVHAIMADVAHQLISPTAITDLAFLPGSNRLDAVNLPIGLRGFVEGRTNLLAGNWTPITNFTTTAAAQAIFIPPSGSTPFYRLRFPFAWSWP